MRTFSARNFYIFRKIFRSKASRKVSASTRPSRDLSRQGRGDVATSPHRFPWKFFPGAWREKKFSCALKKNGIRRKYLPLEERVQYKFIFTALCAAKNIFCYAKYIFTMGDMRNSSSTMPAPCRYRSQSIGKCFSRLKTLKFF